MRAAATDFRTARLLGVRANAVISLAVLLSGAIAAVTLRRQRSPQIVRVTQRTCRFIAREELPVQLFAVTNLASSAPLLNQFNLVSFRRVNEGDAAAVRFEMGTV